MKKSILLATIAAAGVATWLIRRKIARNIEEAANFEKPQNHHLTNVFAKAKTFAQQ